MVPDKVIRFSIPRPLALVTEHGILNSVPQKIPGDSASFFSGWRNKLEMADALSQLPAFRVRNVLRSESFGRSSASIPLNAVLAKIEICSNSLKTLRMINPISYLRI
jgi:hypothetical protein